MPGTFNFLESYGSLESDGFRPINPTADRDDDGRFDAFSSVLSRLGDYTTYSLGPAGESTLQLISEFDPAFLIPPVQSLLEAYMDYIPDGEIGIYRETVYDDNIEPDQVLNLYWAFGDESISVEQTLLDNIADLAGQIPTVFDVDDIGAGHLGIDYEDNSPGYSPATRRTANTIAYSDIETTRLIERFGYDRAQFSSRRDAIADIINDKLESITTGLSTLGYDTTYINHEVEQSAPISATQVASVTSPETAAGTSISFRTSVTTTTATGADGTTSTSTAATTRGTSGY